MMMPSEGLSERVRKLVTKKYVLPAVASGSNRLSIGVRDLLNDTEMEDFPRGRTPVICQVLQGKKLLAQNHLEIESVDGPPSKQSPTVVVHYRLIGKLATGSYGSRLDVDGAVKPTSDPLLELSGVLRGAIREGAAAFLKELRRDNEIPAASNETEHAA